MAEGGLSFPNIGIGNLYVQAVPPPDLNKNTSWFMYPGVWTTYILILFFTWIIVLSLFRCTAGTAWTIVNLFHFAVSIQFIFFSVIDFQRINPLGFLFWGCNRFRASQFIFVTLFFPTGLNPGRLPSPLFSFLFVCTLPRFRMISKFYSKTVVAKVSFYQQKIGLL
jgi:hypothetical protein